MFNYFSLLENNWCLLQDIATIIPVGHTSSNLRVLITLV